MRRLLPAVIAAGLAGQVLFAQGMDTRAKATDWEEINFEFNQAVIVDGFPAMLRLSKLLQEHQDYKVNLVGNTDSIGGNRANDELALKRANAVAQFLQKYGASANQVQVKGDGKRNPESSNKDKNGRFMNRRVVVTVTAPDGTVIGDGSVTAAVNDFEKYARGQLSKIDDLMSQLKQMESELQALKGDTGAIKQDTGDIKTAVASVKTDTTNLVARPSPLSAAETTTIATTAAQNAADYALSQAALRNKMYGLAGVDVGESFLGGRTSTYSIGGFGKAFLPFGNGRLPGQQGTHAIQIDGEWLSWHGRNPGVLGRQDGVMSAGIVNRWGVAQLGAFMQANYVNFDNYNGGGYLGSGIATLDFLFPGGNVGVFGGKGFKTTANLSSTSFTSNPNYIRYEDQIGFHAIGGLGHSVWLESSVAFKKRFAVGATRYPAADVKVFIPFSSDIAMFAGVEYNTTFQNVGNSGRIVVGVEWGNMLHPQQYSHSDVAPVYVPRPHYELLARP